jgi:hypothetical protein
MVRAGNLPFLITRTLVTGGDDLEDGVLLTSHPDFLLVGMSEKGRLLPFSDG